MSIESQLDSIINKVTQGVKKLPQVQLFQGKISPKQYAQGAMENFNKQIKNPMNFMPGGLVSKRAVPFIARDVIGEHSQGIAKLGHDLVQIIESRGDVPGVGNALSHFSKLTKTNFGNLGRRAVANKIKKVLESPTYQDSSQAVRKNYDLFKVEKIK